MKHVASMICLLPDPVRAGDMFLHSVDDLQRVTGRCFPEGRTLYKHNIKFLGNTSTKY
jgi:hypothetical protein